MASWDKKWGSQPPPHTLRGGEQPLPLPPQLPRWRKRSNPLYHTRLETAGKPLQQPRQGRKVHLLSYPRRRVAVPSFQSLLSLFDATEMIMRFNKSDITNTKVDGIKYWSFRRFSWACRVSSCNNPLMSISEPVQKSWLNCWRIWYLISMRIKNRASRKWEIAKIKCKIELQQLNKCYKNLIIELRLSRGSLKSCNID